MSTRGRVLVIDDDEMVLVAAARSLAKEHEIIAETDARRALARIASGQRFDVIFCDFLMPEMTGGQFRDVLLREAPELAARIVFLTGGASSALARDYLAAQPQQVVEKPFAPATLRRIASAFRK